jgi:hypothetical protein
MCRSSGCKSCMFRTRNPPRSCSSLRSWDHTFRRRKRPWPLRPRRSEYRR